MKERITRRPGMLLAIVVVAAIGLRVFPLLQANLSVGSIEYDSGVYYVASSFVVQGDAPYRDFAFLHPPGVLLIVAPAAVIGQAVDDRLGFLLARLLVVGAAALNILLVARLARRWQGPWAGVLAAIFYATHAALLESESALLLEPFLNLACLAAAATWDPGFQGPRPGRRALAVGLLLGAALTIKLWAAVYVAVILGLAVLRGDWRAGAWILGGMTLVVVAVVAPFAVAAPRAFPEQILFAQALRPPDGTTNLLSRLIGMSGLPEGTGIRGSLPWLVGIGVIIVASGWAILGRDQRGIFWVGVLALAGAIFVLSPIYYHHYGAFVAGPVAVLVATWLVAVGIGLRDRGRDALRGVFVVWVAAAALLLMVRAVSLQSAVVSPSQDNGAAIAAIASPAACVTAENPTWLVLADRVPGHQPVAAAVADVFAEQLLAAQSAGGRFPTMTAALHSTAAQRVFQDYVAACPTFIVDRQRLERLAPETRAWLEAQYALRADWTSSGGPMVWQAR